MSPEEAVEYVLQQATTPQEEEQASPTSYPAGLSAREVEDLRLVAEGMTNAQVAKVYKLAHRQLASRLDLPQGGPQLACGGYPLRLRT